LTEATGDEIVFQNISDSTREPKRVSLIQEALNPAYGFIFARRLRHQDSNTEQIAPSDTIKEFLGEDAFNEVVKLTSTKNEIANHTSEEQTPEDLKAVIQLLKNSSTTVHLQVRRGSQHLRAPDLQAADRERFRRTSKALPEDDIQTPKLKSEAEAETERELAMLAQEFQVLKRPASLSRNADLLDIRTRDRGLSSVSKYVDEV